MTQVAVLIALTGFVCYSFAVYLVALRNGTNTAGRAAQLRRDIERTTCAWCQNYPCELMALVRRQRSYDDVEPVIYAYLVERCGAAVEVHESVVYEHIQKTLTAACVLLENAQACSQERS